MGVKMIDADNRTNENVVQDAVNETGFGKFSIKVMAISYLIFLNVAFSISSVGLVLPAATCDFQMNTIDKGRLSASPMLGMMCGSYIWGCYAAIKGRKKTLLIALYLHGISELLASVIPYYWIFIFLKFISGAAMNGQLTIVFLYLGEFQPMKYRDKVLSWMELAWVTGLLCLAGIAWLIIPLDMSFKLLSFTFHSWNLFVMICSFPALIIGTWLISFPETPKYLANTGQNIKMLNVLMRIYSENTGQPPEEYVAKIKNGGNSNLIEFVTHVASLKKEDEIRDKTVGSMMKEIFVQTLAVMKPPFLHRTILICMISCFITSAYYTLTLWLPELFHRYADFEEMYPNQTASICTLSQSHNITGDQVDDSDPFDCNTTVQTRVFLHTFILGASCIPTGLILPLFVKYIDFKYFLVLTSLVPGIVAACLFFVRTSTENLILSCIFEAATSVSINVVYCIIVVAYPTHLRSIAAGLSAFISRCGAFCGILMFGFFVDKYCTLLIVIISAELILSAILAMFTPRNKASKKKPEKLSANESKF